MLFSYSKRIYAADKLLEIRGAEDDNSSTPSNYRLGLDGRHLAAA
jgi:hypothetical protein